MQVSVESTSNLGRRMSITIPSERIEEAVMKRLKDIAKRVKMDGFRAGKVPFSRVEKIYGEDARSEVLHDMMSKGVYEAFTQEKIMPAGRPRLEHDHDNHPKAGEDFKFDVEYEVFPEITLPAFSELKVEKVQAAVADADVEKTIEAIRKQQAKWEEASRPAESGDKVNIDFVGTIDGEPLKGGEGKNFDLELGSNSMIPGFESGLINSTAEQDVTLQATFPEDYHAKELAGKTAEFKVHVNSVKTAKLPELDDEFAKILNVEGGLAELKTQVRNNMERELNQVLKNKNKQHVLDSLLTATKLEVPQALIAEEVYRLQKNMHERLGGKMDFELIVKHSGAQFTEEAHRRVSVGLLLNEIIKEREIKPDAEQVRKAVETLAAPYEKPAELIRHYYQDKDRLAEVEMLVTEDAAIEAILSEAVVTEKSLNFDEVMGRK